jgi:hypothetical protein
MYKREGGLMLCQCGHTKAFHFARPLYYGGPMGPATCAHCHQDPDTKDNPCQRYVEGSFQGVRCRQDPHGGE